jgi:hypothetical protein
VIGVTEDARHRANRNGEDDAAARRTLPAFTFGLDQLSGI